MFHLWTAATLRPRCSITVHFTQIFLFTFLFCFLREKDVINVPAFQNINTPNYCTWITRISQTVRKTKDHVRTGLQRNRKCDDDDRRIYGKPFEHLFSVLELKGIPLVLSFPFLCPGYSSPPIIFFKLVNIF